MHTEFFSLSCGPKSFFFVFFVFGVESTEVDTEIRQLGPGGRRGFDVSIFETTFGTSVWRCYSLALRADMLGLRLVSQRQASLSVHSDPRVVITDMP